MKGPVESGSGEGKDIAVHVGGKRVFHIQREAMAPLVGKEIL